MLERTCNLRELLFNCKLQDLETKISLNDLFNNIDRVTVISDRYFYNFTRQKM